FHLVRDGRCRGVTRVRPSRWQSDGQDGGRAVAMFVERSKRGAAEAVTVRSEWRKVLAWGRGRGRKARWAAERPLAPGVSKSGVGSRFPQCACPVVLRY